MSNKNRTTRMWVSRHEVSDGRATWHRNGKLLPINEGIQSGAKRAMPYADSLSDRVVKNARTNFKPSEETPRYLFSGHHGGKYRDLNKGKITLLDLGGEVNIVRREGSLEYYAARRLHKEKTKEILSQLAEIRHKNILTAIETFNEGDHIYIVIEKMLLSLDQIVRSPPIPTANQIGIIIGQVLDGLVYLQQKELAHGALDCLGVLLDERGTVKLTAHEPFIKISPEAIAKNMEGIAEICMMLMQEYKLDNGKVGVEKVEPWKNSDIIDFLSSTTSSTGAVELRQSQFISHLWNLETGWPKEELGDLIQVALLTVPRNFRHTEELADL